MGTQVRAADEARTIVHLTQQADKLVKRDRVQAELQAEASGSDRKQVQADINRHMGAALDIAKKAPSVQIATGTYAVYQAGDTKIWHGAQNLVLTSADFDAVLDTVATLQGAGLTMAGMRFFVAPETLKAAQDELTSSALNAIRDRARRVAGDLGLAVDHYGEITIGNAGEQGGGPMPRMMAMSASPAPMPPPAAEAGESTIAIVVSADVVLGANH